MVELRFREGSGIMRSVKNLRWAKLQSDLRSLLREYGSKKALCCALGISQDALSRAINSEIQPRAELALALHDWVEKNKALRDVGRSHVGHDRNELKNAHNHEIKNQN
jgi:hypothetical protein